MFIAESKLVFISNELLDPSKREELRLPLEFVSFAFIEGKLYKHYNNEGTFALRYGKDWGNNVVYGAIFTLKDYDFYIRILDSYHQCSQSLLRLNHSKDVHHRTETKAIPISFDTVGELERLQYRERIPFDVQTYLGNLNHPKINQRLNKTVSYRIIDGVDEHLINLIREEKQYDTI